MSEKPAQARKRQASASLRAVASELNITGTRRSYDMSKADFSSLLKDVLAQSSTPDQRRRAEEAKAAFTDALPTRYRPVPQKLWCREVRYRRVIGALPSRPTKTMVS